MPMKQLLPILVYHEHGFTLAHLVLIVERCQLCLALCCHHVEIISQSRVAVKFFLCSHLRLSKATIVSPRLVDKGLHGETLSAFLAILARANLAIIRVVNLVTVTTTTFVNRDPASGGINMTHRVTGLRLAVRLCQLLKALHFLHKRTNMA